MPEGAGFRKGAEAGEQQERGEREGGKQDELRGLERRRPRPRGTAFLLEVKRADSLFSITIWAASAQLGNSNMQEYTSFP